MRSGIRLIIALIVGTALAACLFGYFQVRSERRVLRQDLQRRAEVLAESLAESVEPLLRAKKHPEGDLRRLVDRFGNRERLAGTAVYSAEGKPLAMAAGLSERMATSPAAVMEAISHDSAYEDFFVFEGTAMHVYALPLHKDDAVVGALALFHNASYIEAQSFRFWRDTFQRVLVQTLIIALVTLLIIRVSIMRPIARTAQWMREARTGKALRSPTLPEGDLIQPLVREMQHFARSLQVARAAAQEEARLRQAAEAVWTAERLRVHVKSRLRNKPLFVVSNREPHMHVHRGKSIASVVPASGLVTALEPILRACDGTWIAHGAGDADPETVDLHDHLRVPPEEPQYTLRRVWLSPEEERGHYAGFSNEGLWPLCHIAHTRPVFRAEDWARYQEVNRKFARTVLEEMSGSEEPVLLIQDYHFALLPRLVKEARPDVRVAIFWHIPWPNPEAFGICPWQRELLDGLLGADLVGFHIQSHCNNFLETVDHTLECRIEWERFAVTRSNHLTLVRPFPISVAYPEKPSAVRSDGSLYLERAALFKQLGVEATFMGIGVDRVDYTKGILERFRGIERFLEKYPSYQRQFTFVQVGAPSRTSIERYGQLLDEVELEAGRINARFQTASWKPIVLLKRHHSHSEIEPLYKAADLSMVTSLHDGMNLVAKEFIAARDDEEGALILSRFTGASRELRDALMVNPYDTEQLADAIHLALVMDPEERRARMRRMRGIVQENNIYRWAGNLITELSEIRLEMGTETSAKLRHQVRSA